VHELSIALDVCRIAAERVGPAATGNVITVGLEVGDDAGVEVDNLAFCLEALLTQPPFKAARPVIDRRPGDVLRVTYLEVEDDDPDH
jgi:Zn finger protein HypA/HybF involved in hydrogenase expression